MTRSTLPIFRLLPVLFFAFAGSAAAATEWPGTPLGLYLNEVKMLTRDDAPDARIICSDDKIDPPWREGVTLKDYAANHSEDKETFCDWFSPAGESWKRVPTTMAKTLMKDTFMVFRVLTGSVEPRLIEVVSTGDPADYPKVRDALVKSYGDPTRHKQLDSTQVDEWQFDADFFRVYLVEDVAGTGELGLTYYLF